jgi:hypothetical protein
MAYQNVGTPRFYIDTLTWLSAIGAMSARRSGLNPTEIQEKTWVSDGDPNESSGINFYSMDWQGTVVPKWARLNYWATLGHNLGGVNHIPHFHMVEDSEDGWQQCQPKHKEIINAGGVSGQTTWVKPEYDGFTITELLGHTSFSPLGNNEDIKIMSLWSNDTTGLPNSDISLPFTSRVGAVSIGEFYDMPHSPDLNLKMSIEMDGVKNIKTIGGASLTDINYTKPQDWGNGGAWQLSSTLEDGTQSAVPSSLRSGRRVWDLSFSYLSDTDIIPENAGSSTYAGDGVDSFETNMMTGTDFFSQVWNRTMGGHLPFIFQPDGGGGVAGQGNFNPDQFAIARFDMNSLQYDQVANNVYNVKLKIRECW